MNGGLEVAVNYVNKTTKKKSELSPDQVKEAIGDVLPDIKEGMQVRNYVNLYLATTHSLD